MQQENPIEILLPTLKSTYHKALIVKNISANKNNSNS